MSSEPLLPTGTTTTPAESGRRKLLSTVLVPVLLVVGIIYVVVAGEKVPKDPLGLANYYLRTSPVIDGHIDVPIAMRELYGNNLSSFDLRGQMPGHFDIPRARAGHLGGFFWSIFTDCLDSTGDDFLGPVDSVRDTLEQIDVTLNLIEKHGDTFALCRTSDEVTVAIKEGKIASLMGLEGAHMLGNSLGVLRMYHQLGVRYMTLTHSCNNAFADSAGIFEQVEEKWGGLSPLGKALIREMNRLGVLVDLSHVSDKSALQALSLTRAPVIFSHSDARHFNDISRNAPDTVLDKIGRGRGKVDGVVMVNFYPAFASSDPKHANVSTIADQCDYIADRIGKHHVGVGSDYDGIEATPVGLDDVSKYPYLFAELIRRGWTQHELSLLAGGNLLRVMEGMEAVSRKMRKEGKGPSMAKYDKRRDLDPRVPLL